MKLIYIILISFHNLMDRKIRSILTISGVIIGVAAIVFLMSIGYGFERMTTQQISSPNALFVFDASIDDSDLVAIEDKDLSSIKNLKNVEQVEPGFIIAGKAKNGPVKTDVSINGYSREFIDLAEIKLLRGKAFESEAKDKVLISTGALNLLNISKDDFEKASVSVDVLADKNLSPTLDDGQVKEIKNLKVEGVIDDDKTPLVILPFKVIKKELNIINYNTAKVKVDDKAQLPEVRRQVEKLGFTTSFIGDTIEQINTFFTIFRYIIGGFGVIAMVVAVLGMFNTLTVSLMERTQEIGILKSNGAQRKDIWRLFLSEALIISFIGGVLGVITGAVTGETVNFIFNIYAKKNGGEAVDFFYVPITLVFEMILIIVSIGLLTGLYPARRASKIKILDAIKYE